MMIGRSTGVADAYDDVVLIIAEASLVPQAAEVEAKVLVLAHGLRTGHTWLANACVGTPTLQVMAAAMLAAVHPEVATRQLHLDLGDPRYKRPARALVVDSPPSLFGGEFLDACAQLAIEIQYNVAPGRGLSGQRTRRGRITSPRLKGVVERIVHRVHRLAFAADGGRARRIATL